MVVMGLDHEAQINNLSSTNRSYRLFSDRDMSTDFGRTVQTRLREFQEKAALLLVPREQAGF